MANRFMYMACACHGREDRLNAETMELTNFHLGREQKAALRQRAKSNGSNLADELRSAVDSCLSGITPHNIELLDAATRQAQQAITEMVDLLTVTNRRAEAVFAELEALRGGSRAMPR